MTTRAEHMAWCKERAMEYLEKGSQFYSIGNAIASMMSDLSKHPETEGLRKLSAMLMQTVDDHDSAVKFVEGFA